MPRQDKLEVIEFFVSPNGNDSWSGKIPAPNKTRRDGPFATLQQAQKALRKVKRRPGLKQTVQVTLRGGNYFLTSPLVFTPRDSGTSLEKTEGGKILFLKYPMVYTAYKGEEPIISGGKRITGWKKEKVDTKTVWVATIPEVKQGKWYFCELFVNGKRRYRPRIPHNGFFRIANPGFTEGIPYNKGSDRFRYHEGNIKEWRNLKDVEVIVLNFWSESRMKIKKVDEKKRLVILDRKTGYHLREDYTMEGAQYYVENIFEEIKRGEWYLDRHKGRLYYLPLPGERMETAEIVAPYLTELIRVEGNLGNKRPVEYLHFNRITFFHNQWFCPDNLAYSNQASNQVPGAVVLRYVKNCRFENCTFTHLGTYALELTEDCSDILICGNNLTDLGAGGIKVWHGCRQNTIADNQISNGGILFHSAVGVLIGKSSGNKVLHNHIHNFYYTGISIGWVWGYAESDAYGNIIGYNHIHNIGRGWLSDMGGIYTIGVSTGTCICYNIIHDIRSRGYGGWGIYADLGTTDILIENNLVYRTKSGGFHQHYGKDNILRNNIFAFGEEAQIIRTWAEDHISFIFQNNIVYYNSGHLITGKWSDMKAIFENNLYYDTRNKKVKFPGSITFRQWQKYGMDKGSIVADPLFVDPEHGNFRLKPNSPAFSIGFKEFDLLNVGPRKRCGK